jgi:hypothetical protein
VDRDERERIEQQWSRVLAHWDDDALHRAFVEQCRRSANLGFAAARYQEARSADAVGYRSAHAADAERRLGVIVALAQAEVHASATERPRARLLLRTMSRFALGVLALVLIVFLVLRACR